MDSVCSDGYLYDNLLISPIITLTISRVKRCKRNKQGAMYRSAIQLKSDAFCYVHGRLVMKLVSLSFQLNYSITYNQCIHVHGMLVGAFY